MHAEYHEQWGKGKNQFVGEITELTAQEAIYSYLLFLFV